MSVEERREIAALIAHLNRANDLAYQEELDRHMSAMDAGRKKDAEEVHHHHEESSARNYCLSSSEAK